MTAAAANFISTWSTSISSTNHRIVVRNVTQDGNQLLAAVPMGCQAMWAGSVLAQVADATTGPLAAIAMCFRVLFHPVVSFPLSIVSCAVKSHLYESSVKCPVAEQTRYFARGAPVDDYVPGTVSILINGQMRHFPLGEEITWAIESSALFEKDGVMKRLRYQRLAVDEVGDGDIREMDIDGGRVRVRLGWEVDDNFTQITVGGKHRYYKLGNEVPEPMRGAVAVQRLNGQRDYYLVGDEIPAETPDCITSKTEGQTFHYDTGKELDAPTATSRTFTIDGWVRHFETAKFTSSQSHGLSGWINQISRLPFKLPTRLSHIAVQVLEFTNKNMSHIIRIALIVSGAVLLIFGHTAMALGTLLAVSYEYLDHDLGVVPRKVSLFMEKWMPVISMAGILITGSLFSQAMAGVSLLLMIPSVNLNVHQRLSRVIRVALLGIKEQIIKWFLRGEMPREMDKWIQAVERHPLLEECDAPLVERRVMNAQEVEAVLNANGDVYEFNPAFLTKDFESTLNLPENSNFHELTRLWDEGGVRWDEPAVYNWLFKELTDDKRFILYVKERFPEAKRFFFENDWRLNGEQNRDRYLEAERNYRNQFEAWIEVLAREKGFRTKETFLADWVKQQLQHFVGKINGDSPIEGEDHYLREAIQDTARILPFLLNPATPQFEKEDALLNLAIKGDNDYALGMKRVTKQVLQGFIGPLLNARPGVDVHKAYEEAVCFELQKSRLWNVERIYKENTSLWRENEEMQDTAEDNYLYEAVTRSMKRGFYPLSEQEMEQFTITDLLLNQTALIPAYVMIDQEFRRVMDMGRLPMGPIDTNQTLDYLRAWVEGNNALNAEQKAALLNGALSNDPGHLADGENIRKWRQLVFVILGIVREKRAV